MWFLIQTEEEKCACFSFCLLFSFFVICFFPLNLPPVSSSLPSPLHTPAACQAMRGWPCATHATSCPGLDESLNYLMVTEGGCGRCHLPVSGRDGGLAGWSAHKREEMIPTWYPLDTPRQERLHSSTTCPNPSPDNNRGNM